MRISDWSSDVCSSDLGQPGDALLGAGLGVRHLRVGDARGVVERHLEVLGDLGAGGVQQGEFRRAADESAVAQVGLGRPAASSEERRVGKECARTCRSRWRPYHKKKKNTSKQVN